MSELPEHLGGHKKRTHIDEGALKWAIANLKITSMIDVGCGVGGQVIKGNELGLKALGIDGDFTVSRSSNIEVLIHDYTKGKINLDKTFDLAWSVEFLEHVEEKYMENYMNTFQKCKYVICTYSTHHKGHHHVNVKDQNYWINKFKEYDFDYDEFLSEQIKNSSTMRKGFLKKRGLFLINNLL